MLRVGFLAALLVILASSGTSTPIFAKSSLSSEIQGTTNTTWSDQDWIDWLANIEDLYDSGVHPEGLYWLLVHDLGVLALAEPIMGNVYVPAPPSGGGPLDPTPPTIPQSKDCGGGGYSIQYGGMPETWQPLIDQYGLPPETAGAIQGPFPQPPSIPPAAVAAGISLLGANLALIPHPGAKVAGAVAMNIGGGLTIWILATQEDE